MRFSRFVFQLSLIAPATALALAAAPASAHCDGMDGPVVKAARDALDTGNVNRALIWVQPGDEATVHRAFRKAQAVRKLNPSAKDVADRGFFETVVRAHRAGEGEAFTGLAPAGRDLGPALPAGDASLESGSVQPVLTLLAEDVRRGVERRHRQAVAAKSFDVNDVAAGRRYVQAYVSYIHSVEKIHEAAVDDGHSHAEGRAQTGGHAGDGVVPVRHDEHAHGSAAGAHRH